MDFNQQKGPCQTCAQLQQATDARTVDGHWVALDPDFIPDKQCREWLANGAKYRLDRDPRGVMVAIREGLDQYIEVYLNANRGKTQDGAKLEQWKDKILELAERNMRQSIAENNQDAKENQRMATAMKQVQRDCVIVPVDKAGHNIAFVCKTWYAQKLHAELTREDGAYRNAEETVEEVLNRHKGMNSNHGFQHVEAFPYLYGILKAHKEPVQLRFIAGCSKRGSTILEKAETKKSQEKETEEQFIRRMTREKSSKPKCSLTDAAKEGVQLLRVVMDTLREREEGYFKATGIRKWWTVESTEEVALGIKAAEQKLVGKK